MLKTLNRSFNTNKIHYQNNIAQIAINKVKKIIPKISQSELIALKTGDISIDRDIFKGKFHLPIINYKPNKFDNNILDKLLNMYSKNFSYPNNYIDGLNYIRNNKFLSFIINEKYGGTQLSIKEQSSILTKISSANPALGVCVMVPNSLGPAELLQKYGTNEQKKYYLPKLANGNLIPCFGLTGPHNGSDAIGTIDKGILKLNSKTNELYIDITLNKRYITLAPIADLIGIAFNLEDPNNYIQNSEGICVALLLKDHPGLKQNTYHNPLNVGFPNGTLKGNIRISLDDIIGGNKQLGNGWQMLMECLSEGRAISLPACANASSKVSTFGIYHYINNRKQFNIPLIKMEAIQNKFLNMLYNTTIINSSIAMTNNILDNGIKSGVISAIMKYNTTERGRIVINEAMDIYAGSGICLGDNNFLEQFYKSIPIGITVEGSNTLTRNLIIFGQGLNKSHPYIEGILNSILNNDITLFKQNFINIINHSIKSYFKTFKTISNLSYDKKYYNNLKYNSTNDFIKDDFNIINKNIITLQQFKNIQHQLNIFATLSNILALKGGKLKREQNISGLMADFFCNIYSIKSIIWYEKYNAISNKLTHYCINRLINDNTILINKIIDFEGLRLFFPHINKITYNYDKKLINELLQELNVSNNILNNLKENIYMNKQLQDLQLLSKLKNNTLTDNNDTYNKLYNKVINVGEFNI
jgi:acyl-CoA dehydrogenase